MTLKLCDAYHGNGPLRLADVDSFGAALLDGYVAGITEAIEAGTVAEATDIMRRVSAELEERRQRAIAAFRSLPWHRRAWLTLTGKAPR